MSEPKLLPCPFCGNEVRWCGSDPHDLEGAHVCDQIECTACGFNLDVHGSVLGNVETIADSRAIVAAIWNRRAKPEHGEG